jgi:DNA invertase Pin-like site-specific DNA recombinase
MHPQVTANGATPSLPGCSRTALALIAQAGQTPIDLYERVSGGKQEKQQTIDTQHDVLTSAIELCGGRVGEVFTDNPFTGTVSDRPGLNKLRAAARASHREGRTRYLLMYDTGRLARGEPWLRPMIEDELRRLGVQFAYVLSETDDSDEGMVMDGLRSLFDAWERKKIARRLADGRQKKRNRGAIWRNPRTRPFGWLYRTPDEINHAGNGVQAQGRHPRDGEVFQHPDEAPIVKEMITRIASGEISAHAIAADLNRRGLRTTHGNAWTSRVVCGVVRNPLHSGRVPERQYEAMAPKRPRKTMDERKSKHLKSSHQRIDPSLWTPLPKQPQPIVSPQVQDAALAELRRRNAHRNSTRPTNRFFVLRGLVFCMAPRADHPEVPCGHRMHGAAPPHRQALYRCTHQYPGMGEQLPTRCKTHLFAEALEDMVWDYICRIISSREDRERLLQDMGLAQQSDVDAAERAEVALAAAHRAVDAATAAIDSVVRLYRQGKLAEEDYDRHYTEACGERETARAQLTEAERRRADAREAGRRWDELEDYLKDLETELEEADAPTPEGLQKRAAIIRRLVERVEIYPNGRKRLIGRLRCVTGEMSERVAGGSTIAW